MKYEDYREQAVDGERVWICDYRFNSVDDKAIRHVRPTEVFAVKTVTPPATRWDHEVISYHFQPVGKKGQMLSTKIKPYDNTARGSAVHVFRTEGECKAHYDSQCKEIIERFERAIEGKTSYYKTMIEVVQEDQAAVAGGVSN